MGRRGPKAANVKREPNGRKSRNPIDVTKQLNDQLEAEEREALRTGVEARHRRYGINPGQLRDTDAGSFVGRLRITGEITMQQCEAAMEYCRVYEEMQAAVGGPKPSGAVNLNATKGMPSPENVQKSREAMEAWDKARKAVQARQDELRGGGALYAALDYCVIRDGEHPHMVGWLREGLNALARHFKIGDKRKEAA